MPGICITQPPISTNAAILDGNDSVPPVLVVGRPGEDGAWVAVLVGPR